MPGCDANWCVGCGEASDAPVARRASARPLQRRSLLAVRTEALEDGGDKKEDSEEWSKNRVVAVRANYLGADRAGFQFAVKDMCLGMVAPSEADVNRIKRPGCYMQAVPKVVLTMRVESDGGK